MKDKTENPVALYGNRGVKEMNKTNMAQHFTSNFLIQFFYQEII